MHSDRSALFRLAPLRSAPSRFVPRRFEPSRNAPRKSAFGKDDSFTIRRLPAFAFLNFTPSPLELTKTDWVSVAPEKSTLWSVVSTKLHLRSSAPEKFTSDKSD